eukprot:1332342-Amphidinium_carterae.1
MLTFRCCDLRTESYTSGIWPGLAHPRSMGCRSLKVDFSFASDALCVQLLVRFPPLGHRASQDHGWSK